MQTMTKRVAQAIPGYRAAKRHIRSGRREAQEYMRGFARHDAGDTLDMIVVYFRMCRDRNELMQYTRKPFIRIEDYYRRLGRVLEYSAKVLESEPSRAAEIAKLYQEVGVSESSWAKRQLANAGVRNQRFAGSMWPNLGKISGPKLAECCVQ